MRRWISPLILFAGAFLATLLLQQYTFVYQEFEGLFLCTPDYFSQAFREPLPLSSILADFLTQFFRLGVSAPLIVAAGVTLVFLLVCSILGRFSLGWDVPAAICACAYWIVVAFAPTAKTGVAVLLILLAVWLLSRLLPRRETKPLKAWIDLPVSALLAAGVFLFLSLNGSIRHWEKTSALRVAVTQADWNRVLEIATPEASAQDPTMMPFAFLALGEKGLLGQTLYNYPVESEADFDLAGIEDSHLTLFYKAFLYETLYCPNEAIHNLAQLATTQRHGQSFLVLRRLLQDNYLIGNYALAEKYCAILSRSTLHKKYVRYYREQMAQGTPYTPDSVEFCKSVPLITHNPLYNLTLLQANGIIAPAAVDRTLCTLLLQNDLQRFRALFLQVWDQSRPVPRYYQEALMRAAMEFPEM